MFLMVFRAAVAYAQHDCVDDQGHRNNQQCLPHRQNACPIQPQGEKASKDTDQGEGGSTFLLCAVFCLKSDNSSNNTDYKSNTGDREKSR